MILQLKIQFSPLSILKAKIWKPSSQQWYAEKKKELETIWLTHLTAISHLLSQNHYFEISLCLDTGGFDTLGQYTMVRSKWWQIFIYFVKREKAYYK